MTLTAQPAPAPRPMWPGQEEDAGRFRLHVRSSDAASGTEPALFVHGLGGSSTNWTDLMALLGDRLVGLATDLPGHGRSPASPTRRYPLSGHVDAVEALLDARSLGPVHLFGNSLGGAVSTLLAARRPDLVRTLTLISPAFPQLDPRRATDFPLAAALIPGVNRLAARRMAAIPIEARTRGVLELCYADPSRVHPERLAEEVQEAIRRSADPHAQEAFLASARGLVLAYARPPRRSLWAAAARVTAPVCVIWGAHDRLVPASVAPRVRAAFRRAPIARLEVFQDAGHVSMMERPERTADVVRSFLDDAHAILAT